MTLIITFCSPASSSQLLQAGGLQPLDLDRSRLHFLLVRDPAAALLMVEVDQLQEDCRRVSEEPGRLTAEAVDAFLSKHTLEAIYQ